MLAYSIANCIAMYILYILLLYAKIKRYQIPYHLSEIRPEKKRNGCKLYINVYIVYIVYICKDKEVSDTWSFDRPDDFVRMLDNTPALFQIISHCL